MKRQKRRFKISWKVLPCAMILFAILVNPGMGAEDSAKFPSRPITMIIQFSPGGATDLTGRKLADLASKVLGQPIVVENKPGGGGIIEVTAVAKAPPEGYTIGTVTYGPIVFAPHLRSVPYNPREDFTWIMQYADTTLMFAVRADSPWKTFKEFIEDARKNPGKMTYSTPGPMTGQHIYMEQVFAAAKVKVSHVPATGGQEAASQVLGGHVNAVFTAEVIPHVQAGKLRSLGVLTETKLEQFPDVPTFYEIGYNIDPIIWMGIYAPKGLDPRIHKKLFDAFKKAYEDPSYKELCAALNLVPVFKDSESFRAKIMKDFDVNGKVLKEFAK